MRDCIAILWATDWNDILTAEYLWYEFDKRATGNILDFSVEWHSAILTASLHQASAGRRMIAFRYTSLSGARTSLIESNISSSPSSTPISDTTLWRCPNNLSNHYGTCQQGKRRGLLRLFWVQKN